MSFASIAFVAFAALVAIVYFAVPKRVRWVVLLVASYIFFWINSEWLFLVLLVQTAITFGCGRWMAKIEADSAAGLEIIEDKSELRAAKAQVKSRKKRIMLVGALFNIGALLFLKYWNFFADNANILLKLLGIELPSLGLIMPIGLSFYTLQAVAYIMDVYRNKTEADTSLPKFMLFMSYFPQILQGPIPRYNQLAKQLYEGHSFNYERMCHGAQLMLWGFFMKLVIADRLAIPVDQVFNNWTYYDGWIAFFAAAGYGLQVYADFAGGVNIARGFSQIIGIDMVDNFFRPYFATSIEDFWRRWHVTLGQWMRDYVFYPLSLSKLFSRIGKRARKIFGSSIGKKIPPFIAMFIVYFLVGFWHGASWHYIAYGVWNGIFIMFGILLVDQYAAAKKLFRVNEKSAGWHFFQIFRTFILCAIGRFFSRAMSTGAALGMISSVVAGWWDFAFIVDGSLVNLGLDVASWFVLVAAIVILLCVDIAHERGFKIREAIDKQDLPIRWFVYLAAFAAVVVFGVYGSGYDAASFIYQGF